MPAVAMNIILLVPFCISDTRVCNSVAAWLPLSAVLALDTNTFVSHV